MGPRGCGSATAASGSPETPLRERLGCRARFHLGGGGRDDVDPQVVAAGVGREDEESLAIGRVRERVATDELAIPEPDRDLFALGGLQRAGDEPRNVLAPRIP